MRKKERGALGGKRIPLKRRFATTSLAGRSSFSEMQRVDFGLYFALHYRVLSIIHSGEYIGLERLRSFVPMFRQLVGCYPICHTAQKRVRIFVKPLQTASFIQSPCRPPTTMLRMADKSSFLLCGGGVLAAPRHNRHRDSIALLLTAAVVANPPLRRRRRTTDRFNGCPNAGLKLNQYFSHSLGNTRNAHPLLL